jgi:hypothetical protein
LEEIIMSEKHHSEEIPNPYSEDTQLDVKFDELALAVAKRLRGFFAKALLAFAVLGLTSALSLFGFGITLSEQHENARLIQHQRYEAIFENCVDQNERHDRAIAKAELLLPERAQPTVTLIVDELLPYVDDCVTFARKRVKGKT